MKTKSIKFEIQNGKVVLDVEDFNSLLKVYLDNEAKSSSSSKSSYTGDFRDQTYAPDWYNT